MIELKSLHIGIIGPSVSPSNPIDLKICQFNGDSGQKIKECTDLYYTATNFLGLGTNNPDTKFAINSVAPYITLYNTTSENIANGRESYLLFKGITSGLTKHTLAIIVAAHESTTSTQESYIAFRVNSGSDGSVPAEAIRLNSKGNLLVGLTSGTACIHIKAGTTSAGTAPIKLTSGALLTNAEAGTIEYANNKFYITNKNYQRAIDRTSCVITATTIVSNTTNETTIYACPIIANSVVAGNHIHIEANGALANVSASDDVTFNLYIGSTLIQSYKPAIGNVINKPWHVEISVTFRSIGASASIALHGHTEIDESDEAVTSISTVDTTTSVDITIKVQWDNAKAGNILGIYQGASHWHN